MFKETSLITAKKWKQPKDPLARNQMRRSTHGWMTQIRAVAGGPVKTQQLKEANTRIHVPHDSIYTECPGHANS